MPSTNKLSSRTTRSVAKFLLSFCGLASFGVVAKLVALGTAFLVLFAIPVSITLLSTNNTYATGSSNSSSNTITANLPGSVAIRLLDSTGTTEMSSLDFNNLTPTPQGTTASKSFIVDVATSNPTGYKLYMQSDYQTKDSSGNPTGTYTTNLTHTDTTVSDSIPTTTTSSTLYWNYTNPLTSTTTTIPAYGTPDKIGQYFSSTNSNQTTIDINVGVDTTIVSGTYENQLLFSAVGNPDPVSYNITFDADGGTPEPSSISDTAAASTYTTTIDYTAPEKEGYNFNSWQITSISSGSDIDPTVTCSSNSSTSTNTNTSTSTTSSTTCNPGDTLTISSYGESGVTVALTANYTIKSSTITLDGNNATTAGTSSTTINYFDTTLGTITNPERAYTTSGFTTPSDNNADGSTVSSTSTLTSTYTLTGWYKDATTVDQTSSSELIATSATTPVLEASTTYTNDQGQWTYDGDTTLYAGWTSATITLPTITKTGYTCGWTTTASGATTITYSSGATITPTSDLTLYGVCTVNSYTLTVNPNGGTWSGSTSSQSFTQDYNTTKSISNPTATPTYTISYNANSQGASYTASPTSVSRPFTSWSLSGSGSFAGGTYTFGAGNDTLTANYNTTSSSFTLPTITKSGYTCKWAEGSTSGTQYAGGTSRTITANKTYYVVCKVSAPTSCATATPVTPGSAPTTQNMYTKTSSDGSSVQYVKLYTNSGLTSSTCYTKTNQGTVNWDTSKTLCTQRGGALPSKSDYENLLSAYGSGANLYKATGWSGRYMSSTNFNEYYGYMYLYNLYIESSYAKLMDHCSPYQCGHSGVTWPTICISNS